MNKNLFKYVQAENGDNLRSTAAVLNINQTTLSTRLSGKVPFPVRDIIILKSRWKLTAQQCNDIFLTEK